MNENLMASPGADGYGGYKQLSEQHTNVVMELDRQLAAMEKRAEKAERERDEWMKQCNRASATLKHISQYMHVRGDMQDHAMRQITTAVQEALEADDE